MTKIGSIERGVEVWLGGNPHRTLFRSIVCVRDARDCIREKKHLVSLHSEYDERDISGYGEGPSYEMALERAWVKLSEALGKHLKTLS